MKPSDAIKSLLNLGWTETAIGDAVGVSQPTVNRIKRGSQPSFDVGVAIMAFAQSAHVPSDADPAPREVANG